MDVGAKPDVVWLVRRSSNGAVESHLLMM